MKKTFVLLLVTIGMIVGLHAFRFTDESSITGKVNPPDGVVSVSAGNGSDSVRSNPTEGIFTLIVKPGAWKVFIDAKEPFKDIILDKVEVKEGQRTDLGEIRLQQ